MTVELKDWHRKVREALTGPGAVERLQKAAEETSKPYEPDPEELQKALEYLRERHKP